MSRVILQVRGRDGTSTPQNGAAAYSHSHIPRTGWSGFIFLNVLLRRWVLPNCRGFPLTSLLVSWSLTSLFSTNMAISETMTSLSLASSGFSKFTNWDGKYDKMECVDKCRTFDDQQINIHIHVIIPFCLALHRITCELCCKTGLNFDKMQPVINTTFNHYTQINTVLILNIIYLLNIHCWHCGRMLTVLITIIFITRAQFIDKSSPTSCLSTNMPKSVTDSVTPIFTDKAQPLISFISFTNMQLMQPLVLFPGVNILLQCALKPANGCIFWSCSNVLEWRRMICCITTRPLSAQW